MVSKARIDDVLRVMDPAPGFRPWHGGASPLGSLRGVTEVQAAWRPAADRHSIWELVLHIAYWDYAVRRRLDGSAAGSFPRSPSNWPAVPDPADGKAWKADRDLLRDEHAGLVEAIRHLDPRLLDRPAPKATGSGSAQGTGSGTTYGDLVTGALMHDTYHTGQIQLLKRLYASRG
jgi:uncharacterized damage-inducible protein DinB